MAKNRNTHLCGISCRNFFTVRVTDHWNNLPSLPLWRYSRPFWTLSCLTYCGKPNYSRGVSLNDLQRSLPSPTILWTASPSQEASCIGVSKIKSLWNCEAVAAQHVCVAVPWLRERHRWPQPGLSGLPVPRALLWQQPDRWAAGRTGSCQGEEPELLWQSPLEAKGVSLTWPT